MWLGIVYAYKGILLVFGAFLAWETKNVKIQALNDSRHIGISVYNVFFPCALGMTVVNVVDNNPGVNYAVLSVLVVFCTTMTLCLVFIPKVRELTRSCLSNKWTGFYAGIAVMSEMLSFSILLPLCLVNFHIREIV